MICLPRCIKKQTFYHLWIFLGLSQNESKGKFYQRLHHQLKLIFLTEILKLRHPVCSRILYMQQWTLWPFTPPQLRPSTDSRNILSRLRLKNHTKWAAKLKLFIFDKDWIHWKKAVSVMMNQIPVSDFKVMSCEAYNFRCIILIIVFLHDIWPLVDSLHKSRSLSLVFVSVLTANRS